MSAYLSIDTGRVRTLKGVLDDVAGSLDGVMGEGCFREMPKLNAPPLYETISPGVRWALTVCIMMATVMQALDTTIANVALPYMQGSLSTTQDQINWVLTSYIVAAAIMTSPLGWMATRFGRKKLFIVCTAGFTVASMLCGVALSIEQMVAYRVLQGVFGAALVPLSQAVMLDIFPPNRRGSAMAIWGMGVMLGPIMGPTLGGWLTNSYSWRWVFFVNLPFGILTTAGLWAFMAETPTRRDIPFSWFGFLSLSLGIGSLQMMLDRGEQLGWFDSTEIVVEAILSVVGFYFFLADSLHRGAAVHQHAHLPRLEFLDRADLHVHHRHHPARHHGAGDPVHPEPARLPGAFQRLPARHARHRHVRRDVPGRAPERQGRPADPDLRRPRARDVVAVADGRLVARRQRRKRSRSTRSFRVSGSASCSCR